MNHATTHASLGHTLVPLWDRFIDAAPFFGLLIFLLVLFWAVLGRGDD